MLTATAAGTLLGALWFVPSANATGDQPARTEPSATPTSQVTTQARVTSTDTGSTTGDVTRLADTGSFDTTPYIAGGTICLTLGAGFVVYSVRRERLGF
ncbi:LPXTG-domain-containing protein cell wall anchor domain protein [Streptomyces sp. MMG1533]|uniref:LAETG motif-containing sortase-dependent surface protein n=1 Tax=Streptomyces sp. MMG1533 TaxID=1415546 RepID=UPI0006AFC16C|nr:LAETG motif-containing sortase-dependent surface protein [Streptomyces sp. MMG1533]KOU59149.1 LPXTG-domain-containing protein cell wall anchor domain protein [Streptomyces sp. MMG1533]